MISSFYRYKVNFNDENSILELFKDVPFLNGGLFECLDKREEGEFETRIDCFSDIEKKQPNFPDELFFSDSKKVNLSEEYGDTKSSSIEVSGLIKVFEKYKFTIEENTPLEEEIALDPELLGKVFENLLASYNPETSTTARKQTGSFYTPREIVNYMVEESLIAYYKTALSSEPTGNTIMGSNENVMFAESATSKRGQTLLTSKIKNDNLEDNKNTEAELEANLRILLSNETESNPFANNKEVVEKIIKATGNLKCLDPACGSGAFPMGVLQKLVLVLKCLDPKNTNWKKEQIERANFENTEILKQIEKDIETVNKLNSEDIKKRTLLELEEKKKSIEINFSEHESDYARKLYLIENCIYGVDIQPIAVQITKLRFFISLIVEQKINLKSKNLGIIPLPNLETKFVAANTLIGLEKQKEDTLLSGKDKILEKVETELKEIRKKYFYSRSFKEKKELKSQDKQKREEIIQFYKNKNAKFKTSLEKILSLVKIKQSSLKEIFEYIENPNSESVSDLVEIVNNVSKENKIDSGFAKKAIAECKLYFPLKSANEIASWDPYNQNSTSTWFEPGEMFGVESGFDIVIGNPPYGVTFNEKDITYFRKKYKVVVGHSEAYYLFIENAILSLKKNGVLSYITPNAWLSNKYARGVRGWLLNNTKLNVLINLNKKFVFENAGVETAIFIVTNSKNNKIFNSIVGNDIEEEGLYEFDYSVWFNNEFFNISFSSNPKENIIVQGVQDTPFKLYELLDISNGFKPYQVGYGLNLKNKVLTGEDVENKIYHSKTKKDKYYKPQLKGKNISKYFYDFTEGYIKWGNWLMSPKDERYFKNRKILIRQITGDTLVAAIDDDNFYADQTLYIAIGYLPSLISLEYCLAILNSKILGFYFRKFYSEEDSLFPKIKVNELKSLPIKRFGDKPESQISKFVEYIVFCKRMSDDKNNSLALFLERLIDAMVYELYLPEEIKAGGAEVLKHLGNLPEFKEGQDDKNLKTIEKVYKELSDPKHPISAALLKLLTIEEVNIIEGRK